MNVAFFLIPKSHVAHLTEGCSLRHGMEKLRRHGYTAIPVVGKDGPYLGCVSEGDFLWRLVADEGEGQRPCSMKDLEQLQVRDILRETQYLPVRITVSMEELLTSAMNQNFIPVVDDSGSFIGIVTRKDIIRYFSEGKQVPEKTFLQKIV